MRTEDGSIIQECLNGDPSAFGMLVDKYKAGIYAFVYDKLRDFRDAQDVTQEVFEKAYGNLRSLRHWESFTFWLYRIARNLCRNWLRSQSRRPDQEFIEDQDPAMLEDLSLSSYRENQAYESLREALDSLPDAYREVLLLYYFGGMNIKEIARSLGASPTAIGMRLSRARAQLREEMVSTMGSAFREQKLQSTFTFRVVEAVKRIKVSPMPRMGGLPWGLSLATITIVTIVSLNPHVSIPGSIAVPTGSPLPVETRVLKTGEIPIDILKTSETPFISTRQFNGDGLGSVVPGLQNALFMAPQAEGGMWTKKADMPTARFGLSTSVMNGKIYAIGGTTMENGQFIATSAVEEYDPKTDKWTKKTDMPTPRQYLSTSTVNGRIYAIGGYKAGQGIEFSIVEEYDPANDKWTKKADIPTGRNFFASSVVNGKIYAIGGWRAGQAIASVEEYDPVIDKWEKKTDMPMARRLLTTGVVDGKIYAIGGSNPDAGFNFSSIVEEYDPMTDTWTRKDDMPTSGAGLHSSTVNGKIYVFGSAYERTNVSPVMVYDPADDEWTREADMPTWPSSFSVSEVNGKIYVIGGDHLMQGNHNMLSTVEEYDTGFGSKSVNPKGKLPTTWGDVRTAMKK